jgi:hypothetical protein
VGLSVNPTWCGSISFTYFVQSLLFRRYRQLRFRRPSPSLFSGKKKKGVGRLLIWTQYLRLTRLRTSCRPCTSILTLRLYPHSIIQTKKNLFTSRRTVCIYSSPRNNNREGTVVCKQRCRINVMCLLRADCSLLALPNSKPAMRNLLVMRENRWGGGRRFAGHCINNTYIFYLFITNDIGLLSVVPLLGAVKNILN